MPGTSPGMTTRMIPGSRSRALGAKLALVYPSPFYGEGGWAEGQSGGVVRLHTEAPPPVTSFAPLAMCSLPTRGRDKKERARRGASFARLDPARARDEKKRRSRPERCRVSALPHTQSKCGYRSRCPSNGGRAARGSRSLVADETQSGFASA
jgi:hypothetical protein